MTADEKINAGVAEALRDAERASEKLVRLIPGVSRQVFTGKNLEMEARADALVGSVIDLRATVTKIHVESARIAKCLDLPLPDGPGDKADP